MWDSLISKSGNSTSLEILPSGILWRLENMDFNGIDMKLAFKINSDTEKQRIAVSFQPEYFSISDDWVEDYGGMNGITASEWKKAGPTLDEVKRRIASTCPEQSDNYNKLETYSLSAMNWLMRFACTEKPKIITETLND